MKSVPLLAFPKRAFGLQRLLLLGGMLMLFAGCAQPGGSLEYRPKTEQMYLEAAPITERYFPPPAILPATPAFQVTDRFTTQREMTDFLAGLAGSSDNAYLREMGRSREGEMIPMIVFTRAPSGSPQALAATGLPTVWIHAQQHGNEPASGEGALAVAADLAGTAAYLLERMNVVIVPRVNPYGSRLDLRHTVDKMDLNRDSMRMLLAESRALRRTNLAYAPVLTIDAHEYHPARDALRRWGRRGLVEAHDMLIQGPEHPNIPRAIRDLARDLFIPAVIRDLADQQMLAHEYYVVHPRRRHPTMRLVAGGTEARIGRNFHGLVNQVSILLESRGIGLGRQQFGRRVVAQQQTMLSLLRTLHDHADQVVGVIEQARGDIIRRGRAVGDDDFLVLDTEPAVAVPHTVPYIDLETMERRPQHVLYRSQVEQQIQQTRERPLAYVLRPELVDALRTLQDLGLRVQRLTEPRAVPVQSLTVDGYRESEDMYEGVRRRFVTARLRNRLVALPAGSWIVPMDQPLANLAAEALEPETADSLVCFGVLPARPNEELPVYRLMDPQARAALPLAAVVSLPY
ncbi:MAG: M14 family zinc carboxypeptidase [Burkholderiaceae bacterium]